MKNNNRDQTALFLAQKGALSKQYRNTETSAPKDWLTAFTANPDDLPDGYSHLTSHTRLKTYAPTIAAAVTLLEKHSPTAKSLLEWAKNEKIIFAEKEMIPMGLWSPKEQAVIISKDCSPALAASVMMHEIFHAVQKNTHNHNTSHPNWDFQTELFQTLAGEAGAFSTQCRIAYEMKLSGYPDAWHALTRQDTEVSAHTPQMRKYIPAAMAFENAFKHNIQNGIHEEMALRAGVSAAQEGYIQSDEIKQVYAQSKLSHYFHDIITGRKDCQVEYHISLQNAGKAYLNEKGHLIAQKITHPKTEESLFGHDLKLMHLVRHIENMRQNLIGEKPKTKFAHCPTHSQIIRYTGDVPNPYHHISFEALKTGFEKAAQKSVAKVAQNLHKRYKKQHNPF